jgi:cyclic pyranopterin monophosphate synthase
LSPRQVDISQKKPVYREATASGRIMLSPKTIGLVKKRTLEKGDPVSIAETMAVIAAKKTPDLIALCHPLKIEKVEPRARIGPNWIELTVTVGAHEKTGVEMEALMAVALGLLNIWDVVKAHEKDVRGQYPSTEIGSIKVLRKSKADS